MVRRIRGVGVMVASVALAACQSTGTRGHPVLAAMVSDDAVPAQAPTATGTGQAPPPIPTRIPTGSVGKVLVIRGTLPQDAVTRVATAALPAMKTCAFNDATIATNSGEMVVVLFSVDPGGAVSKAEIDHPDEPEGTDDGLARNGFERCALSSVRAMVFPKQQAVSVAGVALNLRVDEPAHLPPPQCDAVDGLTQAGIQVHNETTDPVVFAWDGPVSSSMQIAAGARMEQHLPQGNYRFHVRDAARDDVVPLFMNKQLVNGFVCAWGLSIVKH